MTQRKPTPKKRPTPKRRKRGLPIQVYVSPDERADIRASARKRGVTVSTLVRNWIAAEWRGALRDSAAAAREDPRQLTILKHATADDPIVVVGVRTSGRAGCVRCGGALDGPDHDWCPACAFGGTSPN
jgi:hypothetical protein